MNPADEQSRTPARTVKMVVSLTGLQCHREAAEKLFEARQWKITSRPPDDAFHPAQEGSARFTLEFSVKGGVVRRSGREADQKVIDLGAEVGLALEPLETDLLWKDARQSPIWLVCAPPWPPSEGESLGAKFRRRSYNWSRRAGFKDTGAVRRRPYPEARASIAEDQSLRPPYPLSYAQNNETARLGRAEARRALLQGLTAALVAGACGPWAAVAGPVLPLPLMLFVASWFLCYRRFTFLEPARRRYAFFALALVCVALFGLTLAGSVFLGAGEVAWGLGFVIGSLVGVQGIRLLLSSWSKRQFGLVVAITLAPVLFPPLLGAGSLIPAFYGLDFGVPPEDMDITSPQKALVFLEALGSSAVVLLFFLAVWGYFRHYRPWPMDRKLTPVFALFTALVALATWLFVVVEPAFDAGQAARAELTALRVPDAYSGLAPEPVCVTPVVPLRKLPADGQLLDPSRVYASFGAVDGKLTLWDLRTQESFPVPASKVRVLAAGSGKVGAEFPQTCPESSR
ncbi:hypothetical protein [Streptomyces sp. NPDC048442]|uniref:hypothetical protein n=1 Tax=Streptomyces sp. NPDC048442 TaxID=3154823 RepID=UPI0034139530